MKRSRRNGGGIGVWVRNSLCDRFNGVAVTVILIGFFLELRMSLYTATFLAETQKSRIISKASSREDRSWKARVVDSWGEPPPNPNRRIISSLIWNLFKGDFNDDDSWIHPVFKPSMLGLSPVTHFTDECVPQGAWQTASYPTCNLLHESNILDHTLLSLKGSWRSAWKVNTTEDLMALKLLHTHRNFTPDAYYAHRIDALAMERLTFSPYVVNVFAFCGQSVLTEYAETSARDVIKDSNLSSTNRLKLARDLALGLSHVHTGPVPKGHIKRGPASLAHLDINIANFVQIRNVTKLNDFNLAMLIPWNVTSKKTCGMISHFSNPLWKSPEEIANTTLIDPARSDVYALGNLLFQIFTKHQPWTHLEATKPTIDEVMKLKLAGNLPDIPSKYITRSNKTEMKALYYATMACFEPNPEKRISSAGIAQALDIVLYMKSKQLKPSPDQLASLFSADHKWSSLLPST